MPKTGGPVTGGGTGQDGADGLTPHIGGNGNWFIGDVDTGVHAQGPQGLPGVGGGATSLRRTTFGTGMVNLASNARCGLAVATDGGRWSRTRHVILRDGNGFRLVYGNWSTGNGTPAEEPNPNPIAVRASLEIPPGIINTSAYRGQYRTISGSVAYSSTATYVPGDTVTSGGKTYVKLTNAAAGTPVTNTAAWVQAYLFPVHFPGQGANREIILQLGQFVVSDLIGAEAAQGGLMFAHSWVTPITNGVRATGSYPCNLSILSPNDRFETKPTGTEPTDYTLTPPTTLANAASGDTFGPMAVLSYPKAGLALTPVVVLRGDSIANGSADDTTVGTFRLANDSDQPGWLFRALGDLPYIRITRGSDSLSKWTPDGTQRRKALMDGGSHYLCEDGTNTIGQGAYGDYDTLRARFVQEWRQGTERGMKVWQSTTTNQTTPANYTTEAEQTPNAYFGPGELKEQWNNWLRDGAPMTTAWVPVPTGTAPGANVIRCRWVSDTPAGDLAPGSATSREVTGWSADHPLVGVVDVAKAVTAANGWAWKVIAGQPTSIGIHPNGLGMQLMAAMVDRTKFTTV